MFRRPMLGTAAVAAAVLLSAQGVPEYYVLSTHKVRAAVEQKSALSSDMHGREVEKLGFVAVDGDVRCDQISVSFEDGHSRWLQLGANQVFKEGALYLFDLTEDDSDLTRVNFSCFALAGAPVTMRLLADG